VAGDSTEEGDDMKEDEPGGGGRDRLRDTQGGFGDLMNQMGDAQLPRPCL
jgi:hypothetical protein